MRINRSNTCLNAWSFDRAFFVVLKGSLKHFFQLIFFTVKLCRSSPCITPYGFSGVYPSQGMSANRTGGRTENQVWRKGEARHQQRRERGSEKECFTKAHRGHWTHFVILKRAVSKLYFNKIVKRPWNVFFHFSVRVSIADCEHSFAEWFPVQHVLVQGSLSCHPSQQRPATARICIRVGNDKMKEAHTNA